jgi:TP901 family phage tail tape measure protein
MPTLSVAIDATGAKKGSDEFTQSVNKMADAAAKMTQATDQTNKKIDSIAATATNAKVTLAKLFGVLTAAFAVKNVIDVLDRYELGLYKLSKVSRLNEGDLRAFGDAMVGLSAKIPVATDELFEMAMAASKLGVEGKDNLEKWVTAVAKLSSVSDLKGKEGATALGLLIRDGSQADMGKTVNMVHALGQVSLGTYSQLVQLADAVDDATKKFDLATSESLGFAAAMINLGVEGGSAAIAVSKSLNALEEAVRLNEDGMAVLQVITGKTREEFGALLKENPAEAFLLFADALKEVMAAGGDTTKVLDALKIDSERTSKILLPLAGGVDELRKSLDLARRSQSDFARLNRDSNESIRTFGQLMTQIKNDVNAVIVSAFGRMGTTFKDIRDITKQTVEVLFGLPVTFNQNTLTATVLARALQALLAAFGAFLAMEVTTKVYALGTAFVTASKGVYSMVAASLALNSALMPVLAIIAAVGVALAAFEFGRYLHDEYRMVQIVGLNTVYALTEAWVDFKYAVNDAIATVKDMWRQLTSGSPLWSGSLGNHLAAEQDKLSMGGISGMENKAFFDLSRTLGRVPSEDEWKKAQESLHQTEEYIKARTEYDKKLRDLGQPVAGQSVEDQYRANLAIRNGEREELRKQLNQGLRDIENDFQGKDRKGNSFTDFVGKDIHQLINWLSGVKTEADNAANSVDKVFNPDGTPKLPANIASALDGLKVLTEEAKSAKEQLEAMISGAELDANAAPGTPAVVRQLASDLAKVRELATKAGDDVAAAVDRYSSAFTKAANNRGIEQLTEMSKKLAEERQAVAMTSAERTVYLNGLEAERIAKESLMATSDSYVQQVRNEALALSQAQGKDQIDEMFRALQDERRVVMEITDEQEVLAGAIQIQNIARESGIQNIDRETAAYRKQREEIQQMRRMQSLANDIGTAFGDAFTDMIVGAKSASEAIKGLAIQIERMVIQQMVATPIANMISGGLGGLFGSFFPTAPVPHALGGIVSGPTLFQMSGGETGLMGEAGPEAIMPLTRGPDGKLGVEASGGTNVTVNQYITTPDVGGFKRSQSQLAADARRLVSGQFSQRG